MRCIIKATNWAGDTLWIKSVHWSRGRQFWMATNNRAEAHQFRNRESAEKAVHRFLNQKKNAETQLELIAKHGKGTSYEIEELS